MTTSSDRDLALLNAGGTGKVCWCRNPVVYKRLSPEANPVLACGDSEFHVWDATGRPEHVSRLYIAGPMTGYPGNNYDAFRSAQRLLEGAGYEVVNPANFGAAGGHYVDLIREDLRGMLDCHAVATLERWWESVGARNEINVAGVLLMPVRPVHDWVARPVRVKEASHGQ